MTYNKTMLITLFGLSMFFTGASGLINEYILSTVSTYILGNSIEQFSITIALMLGFMGVGGALQKYINDDNLLLKFVLLEILLSLLGGITPIAVYSAHTFIPNHFALIQYFFISSIGFLIGFEIPFIIRISQKYTQKLNASLSIVLGADYIGSFVGALVWVYLLLPFIPIYKISFIVSGVNLFVGYITYLYARKIEHTKEWLINIMFIIATTILLVGYFNSEKINKYLEQKLYEDPIVEEFNTKYQHIILTHNVQLNDYRLYINGNTQFSSLDEKRYHELLVHPAMSMVNKPENILVIGGGDGFAVREIKKYSSVKNITLIDLDPDMVKFSQNNKIMKELNKSAFDDIEIINPDWITPGQLTRTKDKKTVNVINIDADKMLWNLKEKFDVIIIDLPDPSSIELAKLYSKEFFLKLKKVMKPTTVGSIQSTSPYHAKESFLCIGNTIEASGLKTMPYQYNIPSFGQWGWWLFGNIQDKVNIEVETDFLTSEVFESAKVFGKGELQSKEVVINTLMFPKLFHIYANNSWLRY